MKLEEQMFKAVADWITSNQAKNDFLKDKNYSKRKFNYWLKKYQDEHQAERLDEFKELEIPHFDKLNTTPAVKSEASRKIEITTSSGFVIKIVEQC